MNRRRGYVERRRGSVRVQLILTSAAILLVLLIGFGLFLRYTVRQTLIHSVDQELSRRVHVALERPPAPPPPPDGGFGGQGAPGSPPPPPPLERPLRIPPDLQGFALPAGTDPSVLDLQPRAFDPGGASMGMPGLRGGPAWDPAAVRRAAAGEVVVSTVRVGGVDLRLLTHPLPPSGPAQGVIQAAYPMTQVDEALRSVDSALLTLIPVALACAALAGALVTERPLARVRHMAQTAAGIGAHDLSRRLPAGGTSAGDEFSSLAKAFNGLLDRLQAAFDEQRRLVEQQRRFTADASHELKTPLTVIRGTTSLALSTPSAGNAAIDRSSVEEIDRAAGAMAALVQDLLYLARADEGILGRDKVVVPIAELIERAAREVRPLAAAPLEVQIDHSGLTVCANPAEAVRLFRNLLENAARFTPSTGRISIRAGRVGAKTVVTVADTGIGIAPEHIPHLGERFYRADTARSRRDGGSGLGLAICKSIVSAQDGAMTIASEPGKGTVVTVALPGG